MMKICIERNYNNHIEVNNLFTRLIGKPYKVFVCPYCYKPLLAVVRFNLQGFKF